jgi:hypothetical protein
MVLLMFILNNYYQIHKIINNYKKYYKYEKKIYVYNHFNLSNNSSLFFFINLVTSLIGTLFSYVSLSFLYKIEFSLSVVYNILN